MKRKIIIVGSGPSGLTAAIYTARANLSPLVIHGTMPGGQLTTTTEVENWPGYIEGIQGPELMEKMENQAKRFGAEVLLDTVTRVDLSRRPFVVEVGGGQIYEAESLIISTGATPRMLDLPNERDLLGYGVSTCATCDGAFFRGKVITVAGGGDSACEEALFLTRFGAKVFIVHRRDELRASRIMRERVMKHEKIEILWNRKVVALNGDRLQGLRSVTLEDTVSKAREEKTTDALFIAVGHTPNSGLFRNFLDLDSQGYIRTSPDSTATRIPGVFACGDVRDRVFRQAVTAAGSGCMAAIEAERWLEALNE